MKCERSIFVRALVAAFIVAGSAIAFISISRHVSSAPPTEKRYKPELVVQTGHHSFICDVAYSPDGKIIASGSYDDTIKLWDASTGIELRTLFGHKGMVSKLAFSPDGRLIASGGGDFAVRIWDVASGKQLHVFQETFDIVTAVAFSPDGKLVYSGSADQTVRAFDIAGDKAIRKFGTEKQFDIDEKGLPITRPQSVNAITVSPDGKTIAVGTYDGGLFLLDSETFTKTKTLPTLKYHAHSLAFTGDGKFLTAASELSIDFIDMSTYSITASPALDLDKDIVMVKTSSLPYKHEYDDVVMPLPVQIYFARLSPDSRFLIAVEYRVTPEQHKSRIRVWSVPDGRELNNFGTTWVENIQSIGFSPDGKTIVTGGNRDEKTFALKLWDFSNGKQLSVFEAWSNDVFGFAVSPNGKTIATNDSVNQSIRMIDMTGGRSQRTIKTDGPTLTPTFKSNDQILVNDIDLKLFDVSDAKRRNVLPLSPIGEKLALSADGKFLAIAEPLKLSLYNANDGTLVRVVHDDTATKVDGVWKMYGTFGAVAIDPTSSVVAVASYAGKVYLFDLKTGNELPSSCELNGVSDTLTFSPDGKLLAVTGRTANLVLCRTYGGEIVRTISTSGLVLSASKSVFTPDGKMIATTDFNDTIQMFDVSTGELLKSFPGNSSPHLPSDNNIVFSSDARLLFSTGNNNSIVIRDVGTGRELASLVTFGDDDWAVVTPDGYFDATEGAQHLMHFVVSSEQGYETISLDQLKRYYVPGLLAQIVSGSYRPRQNDFTVTLFPAVTLEQSKTNEASITADLNDRGGGIGRLEVRVNGSEVYADARPLKSGSDSTKLKFDIPRERLKIGSNSVEVIAWNGEGNVRSQPYSIILDRAADGLITRGASYDSKPSAKKPSEINFYAIVSGISDYAGDGLDLRYAAKDAEDISKATSLAARKYFCANEMAEKKPCTRIHIRLLSTESDNNVQFAGLADVPDFQRLDPVKANYASTFAEVAKNAGPDDVVFLYFSGHATSITSDDAVKDSGFADTYVYATREATTLDRTVLTNRSERERTAVSSLELAKWLSDIKAQKKVLILDTCAAGAAQNDLVAQARAVDALQVRSIDRLQERTGFYVLMGSAADAVSYEANEYKQGLLTYSLLEGMTLSSTLSEGGFLDVEKWFGFSEDKVEDLAKGIGGIQRPSFFKSPTARSFDIGRIESSEVTLIPVARRVPLILQPELREEGKRTDPERLTDKLQSRLIEQSLAIARGQAAAINYVNASNAANGLSPRGSYTINGDVVTIELSLISDEKEVVSIKVSGTRAEIVDKLARELISAASLKK